VVDFLHEAGVKLRVSMAVVAAAAAFFLRSLASGGSPGVLVMPRCLEKYDRMLVAATCLFLATKVEEQPRRIRDVLNTTHRIAYPGRPPLVIDQEFAARREAIVTCEQSVLRALRFDTEVPSPHTHLVTVAQDLECQKEVLQLANVLVNDALRSHALVVATPPTVLAAACLHVASRLLEMEVAGRARGSLAGGAGGAGGRWWADYGVEDDALAVAAGLLLELYGRQQELCQPQMDALGADGESGGRGGARGAGGGADDDYVGGEGIGGIGGEGGGRCVSASTMGQEEDVKK
jgi:hypothetical protein